MKERLGNHGLWLVSLSVSFLVCVSRKRCNMNQVGPRLGLRMLWTFGLFPSSCCAKLFGRVVEFHRGAKISPRSGPRDREETGCHLRWVTVEKSFTSHIQQGGVTGTSGRGSPTYCFFVCMIYMITVDIKFPQILHLIDIFGTTDVVTSLCTYIVKIAILMKLVSDWESTRD